MESASATLRMVRGWTLRIPLFSIRLIVLRFKLAILASSLIDQKVLSLATHTLSPSIFLTFALRLIVEKTANMQVL